MKTYDVVREKIIDPEIKKDRWLYEQLVSKNSIKLLEEGCEIIDSISKRFGGTLQDVRYFHEEYYDLEDEQYYDVNDEDIEVCLECETLRLKKNDEFFKLLRKTHEFLITKGSDKDHIVLHFVFWFFYT